MNRELDRQIAINFHPGCLVKETLSDSGRDRGFINNMLAWDNPVLEQEDLSSPWRLENGGSWTHCKDDIWATENLPHYSEDLNLAIRIAYNIQHPEFSSSYWEFRLETDYNNIWWAIFINFCNKKEVRIDNPNPAEAICLARLKLKEDYGVWGKKQFHF